MNKNNLLDRSYITNDTVLKKVTPTNINKNSYSAFFNLENKSFPKVNFSKFIKCNK